MNDRSIAGRARWAAAAALLLCLSAGCTSMPWRKVPLDAASGMYADATLTYTLDAGKLGQPLDALRVEGRAVAYDQVASSPLAGESIGTLTIVYPHPAGRAGSALARFSLDSASQKQPDPPKSWRMFIGKKNSIKPPRSIAGAQPELHETWELDIAQAELDQILKMLTNMGYYNATRAGATAQLAVKMNGTEQSKEWDQVPPLNALVQRVRGQGRLVAYSRPAARGGAATTITSGAAYRELAARLGPSGPQASPAANAFAMTPAPAAAPATPFPPGPAPNAPYPAAIAGRPATVR